MKVIYMGTPACAGLPLKAIVDAGHQVVAVVTRPPRKAGRNCKEPVQPEMYHVAMELGLPVLQPELINEEEFVSQLAALEADIIVTAAYSAYLKEGVLNAAKYKTINIHPSLLPRYRGASPVQSALIQGESRTGVSIIFSVKEMDAGDIILQEEHDIMENENAEELMDRLFHLSAPLLCKALECFEKGEVPRLKQNEEEATYFKKLEKESGYIDWNLPAEKIHNLIRGTYPWPGAFTSFGDKGLQIWKSRLFTEPVEGESLPGSVVAVLKNRGLVIGTGKGLLLAEEVQSAGKKRMKGDEWARGIRGEKIIFTQQ